MSDKKQVPPPPPPPTVRLVKDSGDKVKKGK